MATQTNFDRFENYLYANQHLTFIDSVSFLPMPLRKLPEAFGLSVTKSWHPHFFNTKANLNYVGPIPDISQFGNDEMGSQTEKNS